MTNRGRRCAQGDGVCEPLIFFVDITKSVFVSLIVISNVYNLSFKDRAKQIRERLAKEKIYEKRAANMKLGASQSILNKISQRWQRNSQQGNGIKIAVYQALEIDYKIAAIALEIHLY